MSYPPEITVDRNSEEFDELVKHSELIREMTEDSNEELIINKNFFGNEKFYELFVELFYPTRGEGDIFYRAPDGGIAVNPRRATSEEVASFMDFLLIDKPATMMNFAREKASETMGITPIIEPRGKGIRTVGVGAREYSERQEKLRERNKISSFLEENEENEENFEERPRGVGAPQIRINNNNTTRRINIQENVNTRTVPAKARPYELSNYIQAALQKKKKSQRKNSYTRRGARRSRRASRKTRK